MAVMHVTHYFFYAFCGLTGFRLILRDGRTENDQLALLREVERTARLFLQHVLFQRSLGKKLDAMLQKSALPAQALELGVKSGGPLLQPVLGVDAELALEGVESEIGKERNRDRRDDEGSGPSFLVLTCPHGGTSYYPTRSSCHAYA